MAGYNGWTDYTTWRLAAGLQDERPEQVAKLIETAAGQEKPAAWLAERLKDLVMTNEPLANDMYADIILTALDEANYMEIAESYLAD